LLGNGDGTFQPEVTYDSGGFVADAITVADVNGDGKPDLAMANAFDNVGILLGNGDGTFQAAVTYDSGGGNAISVALVDVNGDGKPDLAVLSEFSRSVGVLLNNFGAFPTTTSLVSSANPADFKQMVTYTATVTGSPGRTLKGTMAFRDGGSLITTVTLTNNQATYSTAYPRKIATHAIIAEYSGNLHHAGGSRSATLTEYIRAPSITVVASSGSPTLVGQPVTFTATVTSGYGAIPDGELVTFHEGTTILGSGTLSSGVAAITTSALSGKTHAIKAIYAGDTTFRPSTALVIQIVEPYSTTTNLRSSENPSAYGHTVTFAARVESSGPNRPTGKVKFRDARAEIGTATVNNGVAKLTRSRLAVGTHPINAEYLGDAVSARSTSAAVYQVVK
jgi:hypothetical protein